MSRSKHVFNAVTRLWRNQELPVILLVTKATGPENLHTWCITQVNVLKVKQVFKVRKIIITEKGDRLFSWFHIFAASFANLNSVNPRLKPPSNREVTLTIQARVSFISFCLFFCFRTVFLLLIFGSTFNFKQVCLPDLTKTWKIYVLSFHVKISLALMLITSVFYLCIVHRKLAIVQRGLSQTLKQLTRTRAQYPQNNVPWLDVTECNRRARGDVTWNQWLSNGYALWIIQQK